MSAPRIVGRNYTEATNFALETLGLAPRTYRVITTVGGLAGYRYTLHLAPGWSKAPYAHALRNKIKFKRNIEVIDHETSVQKESTREVETIPEPPEGWFPFGTFANNDPVVDTESSEEKDAAGIPWWERPIETDDKVVEMRHCDGCGEDYDALSESHVGHEIPEPDTEETDAETGTKEPGEDVEGSEKPVQRRRRRCKKCGELVEPDDVEAHAAEHEAE